MRVEPTVRRLQERDVRDFLLQAAAHAGPVPPTQCPGALRRINRSAGPPRDLVYGCGTRLRSPRVAAGSRSRSAEQRAAAAPARSLSPGQPCAPGPSPSPLSVANSLRSGLLGPRNASHAADAGSTYPLQALCTQAPGTQNPQSTACSPLPNHRMLRITLSRRCMCTASPSS